MLDKAENLTRILHRERPERIPVESFFDPRYGEGAYTLVGFLSRQPPREGGQDIWGESGGGPIPGCPISYRRPPQPWRQPSACPSPTRMTLSAGS